MDDLRDALKWTRRSLALMIVLLIQAVWFDYWASTAGKVIVSILCANALLTGARLYAVERRTFAARRP